MKLIKKEYSRNSSSSSRSSNSSGSSNISSIFIRSYHLIITSINSLFMYYSRTCSTTISSSNSSS